MARDPSVTPAPGEGVPGARTGLWLLGLLGAALLLRGYGFPGDNHFMEAPPILHMASGGAEFAADYYVQEMVRFTPRFYYNHLVAGLGRAVGVPAAFFLLWLVAGISWMSALWRIGRRTTDTLAGGALLAGLGICAAGGTLGSVGLWTSYPGEVPSPVPAVLALGLVGWGVAFALERRWDRAYAFFGAACLLQFLVGLLPGALFLPAMALGLWRGRRGGAPWWPALLGIGLWGAGAAAVYLPMVLSGTSGTLDAATFFHLYAEVRHPHHIMASGWTPVAWVDAAALLAGTWLVWPRRDVRAVVATIAAAVLVGVVFTELVPVALFAKLQLARTTPWGLLLALTASTVASVAAWQRGNKGLAVAFALAPLTPWPGLALLVLSRAPSAVVDGAARTGLRDAEATAGVGEDDTAIGEDDAAIEEGDTGIEEGVTGIEEVDAAIGEDDAGIDEKAAGGGAGDAGFHGSGRRFVPTVQGAVRAAMSSPVRRLGMAAALVCTLLVVVGLNPLRQAVVLGVLLAGAWAWSRGGRSRALAVALPAGLVFVLVATTLAGVAPPPISTNLVLFEERSDPLMVLAKRVNQRSLPEDVFLVPPFVPDFKLYARRAVVVDFKCFPYTDRGIQMWAERLEAVYDQPVDASINWSGDPVTPWARRDPSQLLEVAQRYGADYLLTRAEWHPRAPAVLVDQEEGWLLYKLPEAPR